MIVKRKKEKKIHKDEEILYLDEALVELGQSPTQKGKCKNNRGRELSLNSSIDLETKRKCLQCRVRIRKLDKTNKYYRRYLRRIRESNRSGSGKSSKSIESSKHKTSASSKSFDEKKVVINEIDIKVSKCGSGIIREKVKSSDGFVDRKNNNSSSGAKKKYVSEHKSEGTTKSSKVSDHSSKEIKKTEVRKLTSFSLSDALFGSKSDPGSDNLRVTSVTKIVKIKKKPDLQKERINRMIKECQRRKVRVKIMRLTKSDLAWWSEKKKKNDKLRSFKIPKISKPSESTSGTFANFRIPKLSALQPVKSVALPKSIEPQQSHARDKVAKSKKKVRFSDIVDVEEFCQESSIIVTEARPRPCKSLKEYMIEKHPTAFHYQHAENTDFVRKLLQSLVSDIVTEKELGTRWFCPICDQFDVVPSYCEADVKKHIAVQHGDAVLDIPTSNSHGFRGENQCRICHEVFVTSDELLTHAAYDHKQLRVKIQDFNLSYSEYLPLAGSRKDHKIRYDFFDNFSLFTVYKTIFLKDGNVYAALLGMQPKLN